MSENQKVWLNGKMIPYAEATVPILSHGFSRGSAVFEVFGIHVGPDGPAAFRMDEHLKRLAHGLPFLDMELAYTLDEIAAATAETVRINNMGRGFVKIMAYWGEEAIIKLVLDSKLDVAIFAIPASPELALDNANPISACFSRWRKLHPETVPVEAKACAHYLNGYLARRDAMKQGYDLGIMLGTDGFLAEGSIESVFMVKDGVLKTPLTGRILSSITRKSVLEAAPVIGIPVSETFIFPEELKNADEIFISHSGIKVCPVKRLEDRDLPAPGPVTQKIMDLMESITSFSDQRFQHWFQPM